MSHSPGQSRLFLIGVGTSVLGAKNISAFKEVTKGLKEARIPLHQALHADKLPGKDLARLEEQAAEHLLSISSMRGNSAEIDTLACIHPAPRHGEKAVLFASDSPDGVMAARLVGRVLAGRWGLEVEKRLVEGLDVGRPGDLESRGMLNLLRIAGSVLKAGSSDAHVIATGGFKIIGSYLTLAGLLNGARIHYLFQEMDRVVSLPRIRLLPDTGVWHRHFEILLALERAPLRADGAPHTLDPELDPFLEFSDGGALSLSPIGAALCAHARDIHEDPLTHAWRRSFLDSALLPFLAGGKPACGALLLADIDKFKTINDTHGHEAGDAVLVEFSSRLAGALENGPEPGHLIRWGGEEFLVILPGINSREDLLRAGERLRNAVRSTVFNVGPANIPVTATFGGALWPGDTGKFDIEDLRKIADKRLYSGKQAGRDQVVVSDLCGG